MTREQAKELLPIIKAFSEGKTIQRRFINGFDYEKEWVDDNLYVLDHNIEYRIKPEPKYRPFKDAEECWREMLKHEPFEWVIKLRRGKIQICELLSCGVILHNQSGSCYDFEEAYRILTFADETPFGIKENN